MFVRMGVGVALLSRLPTWATHHSAMTDWCRQLGWGTVTGASKQLLAAIAKKWGKSSIGQNEYPSWANPIMAVGQLIIMDTKPGQPYYDFEVGPGLGPLHSTIHRSLQNITAYGCAGRCT